jgi:hypothetical protein
MATEEQLLNTIFADATSPNEKAAAVEALKKATGKDRAALVEKYTKTDSSSSSSSWGAEVRAREVRELRAENITLRAESYLLQNRLQQAEHQLREAERRHQLNLDMAHDAIEQWKGKVAEFERLAGQLAITLVSDALSNDDAVKLSIAISDILSDRKHPAPHMLQTLEWMIDGPIKRYMTGVWTRQRQAEKEQRKAQIAEVQCAAPGCSNLFRPSRRGHKTCSDACRQALSRSKPTAIQHHG